IKLGAAFPTDHRLHAAPPGNRLAGEAKTLIAKADVILSLDWLDLGGALKQALGSDTVQAKIIQISCDAHAHRGWSMDYHILPPVDVYLMCDPDAAVPMLLEAVEPRSARAVVSPVKTAKAPEETLTLAGVAHALEAESRGIDRCFTRLPLGWHGSY